MLFGGYVEDRSCRDTHAPSWHCFFYQYPFNGTVQEFVAVRRGIAARVYRQEAEI